MRHFEIKHISGIMSSSVQSDSDVHISRIDQTKINEFARMNARLNDLKELIKVKENDLRNLEDAVDEIALLDDADPVPYSYGEIFVSCSLDEANGLLEKDKSRLTDELKLMKSEAGSLLETMSDLKTHLYAKFGDNINLEPDPEDDD
ncbi:unnamed protein product [Notodromas monacha]|uniref:Prefoldin subunit 4 n=1 Tax=Notodromas monacha TaxID=399045 RepID=A0A7R9BEC0_9CRUS|nr:unnamed protein product [Notodromas monacha]CAG0913794.1 unnamed protein product [Notodromas monacha]